MRWLIYFSIFHVLYPLAFSQTTSSPSSVTASIATTPSSSRPDGSSTSVLPNRITTEPASTTVVAGSTTSPRMLTSTVSVLPTTTTSSLKMSSVKPTPNSKFVTPISRTGTDKLVKTKRRMRDCGQILLAGYTTTGAYNIYPFEGSKANKGVYVRCDMDTDGGGWTILYTRNQRGVERESFDLNNTDFMSEDGFGSTCGDAWIGLPTMSALTARNDQQVKISETHYKSYWNWNGYQEFANYYRYFQIVQYLGMYQMLTSVFQSGNLADSLAFNGSQFFTKDNWPVNCSKGNFIGPSWYKNCQAALSVNKPLNPSGFWGNEVKIRNPFLKWNTTLGELTILIAKYKRLRRSFIGNTVSGVYKIYPDQTTAYIHVYCDMTLDGGGWTTILQRGKYAVEREDFSSYTWTDYQNGFGSTCGDLIMGMTNLHTLLSSHNQVLRIDMTDWESKTAYANYGTFWIGGASELYALNAGNYSGTAGDSLSPHSGFPLSTPDQDNDAWEEGNCAEEYGGAWWYAGCVNSNLNGEYLNSSQFSYGRGIIWSAWKGYNYSIKSVEMRIRNVNFLTLKAMFGAV